MTGLLLAAIAASSTAFNGHAGEVRVAVAGNFLPALERLAPDFEGATGHRLRLSSGSTGKLYAQVRRGAPYDLFLAADVERPARLEAEGLAIPGTRVTYARGRLVLWAPAAAPGTDLYERLRDDPPPLLAIANPRLAPYGAAAQDFLRQQDLWGIYESRVVRGENIAQTHHFVASGNATLGLIALSQLRLAPAAPGGAWCLLPADAHRPIEQQAVLLRDTDGGRDLLDWLLSEATRTRLPALGYDPP